MGAPRRFFRRGGGYRGSRGGAGGPPRRSYQDDNQVKYFGISSIIDQLSTKRKYLWFNCIIRIMNTVKVMKMEQTDPVPDIAAATIALEHEVMVLLELTAKVTTNPNKK